MTRRALAIALAGLLLSVPARADAGELWRKLWRTPDQRGAALLQSGNAKAAASTFENPRLKAYAELQAKNYAAAAKQLTGLDASDDHYNRGNALAASGDLPAAVKAYDEALKRNPGNRDAEKNRELVQQAMKQQSPPPEPKNEQNQKDQKPKDQDGRKGEPQQSKPDPSQDGKDGQKDAAKDQKPDGNPQEPKDPKSGDHSSGDGKETKPRAPEDATKPAKNDPKQGSQQPPAPSPSTEAKAPEKDSAAKAEQDVQPGAQQPRPAPPPAQGQAAKGQPKQPAIRGGQPPTDAKPLSEAQLAQEQWLRRIPDDPGGLLRRKFMIEHLMRQQGGTP